MATRQVGGRVSIADLLPAWDTRERCVRWCEENGLFPSSVVCHHCSGHCIWVEDGNLDGWIWRCRRKGCQRRRSPRIGTIFEYSELPLSTALQTIYWWSRGLTVQQAVTVVGTSKVTVVEWFYRCRDICANYLLEHHRPIGGIGHVVELDETKIGHRKYNRGRLRDGVWVVGGLDQGTKRCVPLDSRGQIVGHSCADHPGYG